MDDALVQDDGIDLIGEELDRCWEVTQDQDKASKVEKAIFETQRDVKMETTFMSHVARRKLNFQKLENAMRMPLSGVIKVYATLRDAKLAENSYDKVVMWTGGSYDYDDVMRALVRLDRPEMPPGTSGQSGKTVPIYFTDPEVDAPTIVPGSEFWTQSCMDRTHWNAAHSSFSTGNLVAKVNNDSKFEVPSADVSNLTESPMCSMRARGNDVRQHKEKFKNFPEDLRVTKATKQPKLADGNRMDLRNFADALASSQEKTTGTLPHGKKESDTQRQAQQLQQHKDPTTHQAATETSDQASSSTGGTCCMVCR